MKVWPRRGWNVQETLVYGVHRWKRAFAVAKSGIAFYVGTAQNTALMNFQTTPGPSQQKPKRPKKSTKHGARSSKLKSITEKQKIEALENEASAYVCNNTLIHGLVFNGSVL